MRQKFNALSLALLFSFTLFSGASFGVVQPVDVDELRPYDHHRRSAIIIVRVINSYHYHNRDLDDKLSEEILDRYIESLDPNRSFFTQKDIDTINIYRDRLDNAIKDARLWPAFNIFKIYRSRVERRVEKNLQMLDKPFDFTIDEQYEFDRSEAPWAKNGVELDEVWRKRLKSEMLGMKLSDKSDEEIVESMKKRYESLRDRVVQLTADEVFQSFINAYTLSLEPHTSYMSPSTAENFSISMRLSLTGVGLVLSTDNEYTVVESVVTGGPADLNGEIQPDDHIVGVAQGDDGEIEDIVGWRLQDVVEKIRGPKDSIVRLEVVSQKGGVDGPQRVVRLQRNKIKLEDQAAQSKIFEKAGENGKLKIGVIDIPTFYRDFKGESDGDEDFRSTTRDVAKLIEELKEENVDGIVIDLRNNGGGSLLESTELTGLFIPTGPVVQVKNTNGKLDIERDSDPKVVWDGPLAVLVNRNSASASEIFAGAIQDYQRGLIIGEPTFGKGTVQTLIDLERFVRDSEDPLGRLRLTMAQFFRVNGGSTQYRGVMPDILFPMVSNDEEHGERSLENSIPWASVDPLKVSKGALYGLSEVRERHYARIDRDPGFQYLNADAQHAKELKNRKFLELQEEKRRKEWDTRENRQLSIRNDFRAARGLEPVNTEDLEDRDLKEAEAEARRDIQRREAANILADQIEITHSLTAANQ